MTDFPPFEPTPSWRKRADELAAPYAERGAALLPLLHEIQERHGCVADEAEAWAAEALGVSRMRVREVMSFYTMFRRDPRGRHHVRVCRNLSCTLMGAEGIIEELRTRLGCEPGETTESGEFSWEIVECMGACEMAPMVQCDETYLGPVGRQEIGGILASPPEPVEVKRPKGKPFKKAVARKQAVEEKPDEEEPAAKKPVTKKKPARKPAAKKPAAKKTETKKPTAKKSGEKPSRKTTAQKKKSQRRGLPKD